MSSSRITPFTTSTLPPAMEDFLQYDENSLNIQLSEEDMHRFWLDSVPGLSLERVLNVQGVPESTFLNCSPLVLESEDGNAGPSGTFDDNMLQGDCSTDDYFVDNIELDNGWSNQEEGNAEFRNTEECPNVMPLNVWLPSPVPNSCTCCQVLREIVHSNGTHTTKLEIHGRIGLVHHAILGIQIENDETAPTEHQMIDFSMQCMEDVRQYLRQYCHQRKQAGFIMLEDPLLSFYSAVCVGLNLYEDMNEFEFTQRIQTEPVQMAPFQTAPVHTEPIQTEPALAETIQIAPFQSATVHAEPVLAETVQVAPFQTAPVQAEPMLAETVVELFQTEPIHNEPVPVEPVQAERRISARNHHRGEGSTRILSERSHHRGESSTSILSERSHPRGESSRRILRRSDLAAQRERTGKMKLSDFVDYFHFPIEVAARKLGICPTVLKKLCRKSGIRRWPHRKIKSLDRQISTLESSLGEKDNEREAAVTRAQIAKLKQQRDLLRQYGVL